ncbi:MAG: VWA domain-containing protein [Treponema sp.]|jgi:Ca-activated chloride channel family protein|nr:VWA domain-containing protein [Treponema sp.]
MSFGFERPLLIPLAALTGFLILGINRFVKDPFALKIPLGPPGGTAFVPPFKVELLIRLIFIMELAGMLFLFIAASGPYLVSSETVWLNRGADVLFVLDVSPSMAGLDMDGINRFDAARNLVAAFAQERPSDAVGLAAVGDSAALLIPPTVDRDALNSRLRSLQIAELGDGTALGLGLSVAALHVRKSSASRKVVVLITDGENNAGPVHPETAAAVLREEGISLWVIGVGSSGEVPIDYVDPYTRVRRTGSFYSRFEPENLMAIAEKAGGTYLPAPSAKAFAAAFARLHEGEMIIRRSGLLTKTHSIHRPLIIAALILLYFARFVRRYVLGALL